MRADIIFLFERMSSLGGIPSFLFYSFEESEVWRLNPLLEMTGLKKNKNKNECMTGQIKKKKPVWEGVEEIKTKSNYK